MGYLAHITIRTQSGTLLRTSDVPQLQAHNRLVIPVEHFEGKVHPDGGAVVLGEDLVDVALYDGRFPHSQVSDDQNFEQALVLHYSCDCQSAR